MRQPKGLLGLVVVSGLVVVGPARASSNDLAVEVVDLEQQANGLAVRFRPQPAAAATQAGPQAGVPEQRLVDAQVLYNLGDFTRAAILLLDYVGKYKNTRGYPEALYYLADSLYQRRDFISARRYFREIVEKVRGLHYQDALQRLIELSLRTGDSSRVKGYLDALATIPPSQLKPSVPYVRGKYYYFQKQTNQAIRAFRRVPAGQPHYLKAQYFIGACQVRNKDYAGARKTFAALLAIKPKTRGGEEIHDLAHLATGRLLYQEGKIGPAIDRYQQVSRHSASFETALYEISWAYIKAQQYDKALRALDLLVLANPDGPLVPDVSVLQGNLLIRLRSWGRATSLFTTTRKTFSPVQTRLQKLLAQHEDPDLFFDALLERDTAVDSPTVLVKIPELATYWVRERPGVKRVLGLVADVREVQESIDDARALIRRLNATIESPARIKVFPIYAKARTRAMEVENRLADVRRRILADEHRLIEPTLTPGERAELAQLATERRGLDRRIERLPTDKASFRKRTTVRVRRVRALEKAVGRLAVTVQSMRAELAAAEKYFRDTGATHDAEVRASFRKQADRLRLTTKSLQKELDDLTLDLTAARELAGVGGPREVAERGLKERYRVIVEREHKFLLAAASRLSSPAGRARMDQYGGLMSRCDGVDTTLRLFGAQLDESVEERLVDIRRLIAEEGQNLAKYEADAGSNRAESDELASLIARVGYSRVAERFSHIVVRANVGIIDVAWALKDSQSKDVSRLVHQRKLDLKLLDSEYKEVLTEK